MSLEDSAVNGAFRNIFFIKSHDVEDECTSLFNRSVSSRRYYGRKIKIYNLATCSSRIICYLNCSL